MPESGPEAPPVEVTEEPVSAPSATTEAAPKPKAKQSKAKRFKAKARKAAKVKTAPRSNAVKSKIASASKGVRAKVSSEWIATKAKASNLTTSPVGIWLFVVFAVLTASLVAWAVTSSTSSAGYVGETAIQVLPIEAEAQDATDPDTLFTVGVRNDPVAFGVPTQVSVGGSQRSVWSITVNPPRAVVGTEHRAIEIVVQLDSANVEGPIAMPTGTDAERWRLSYGGLFFPASRFGDTQECARDSSFREMPRDIRLNVGEQIVGWLCIRPPSAAVLSRRNPPAFVELVTPVEHIVWTTNGRQGPTVLDRSLGPLLAAGAGRSAVQAVDLGQRGSSEVWDVVVLSLIHI